MHRKPLAATLVGVLAASALVVVARAAVSDTVSVEIKEWMTPSKPAVSARSGGRA